MAGSFVATLSTSSLHWNLQCSPDFYSGDTCVMALSKNMVVGILKAPKGFSRRWFKRLPPPAICFATSAEDNLNQHVGSHAHLRAS